MLSISKAAADRLMAEFRRTFQLPRKVMKTGRSAFTPGTGSWPKNARGARRMKSL